MPVRLPSRGIFTGNDRVKSKTGGDQSHQDEDRSGAARIHLQIGFCGFIPASARKFFRILSALLEIDFSNPSKKIKTS